MRNCKNCYHYHMCDLQYRLEEHQDCKHYKDKSFIVELPRKVGDKVYAFFEPLEVILGYDVLWMGTNVVTTQYTAHAYEDDDDECILIDEIDFDIKDVGKTVFLTKEEAEKKLREHKGE